MVSQPRNTITMKKPRRRVRMARGQYSRNDLYRLAVEFKRRHPKATGAEAWEHFASLAGMSSVVLGYSTTIDVIEYAPDSDRWGTRRLRRESFERSYRAL